MSTSTPQSAPERLGTSAHESDQHILSGASTPPRASWEIRPSSLVVAGAGQGCGAFSTRPLLAGETIIEEVPLLTVEVEEGKRGALPSAVFAAFSGLSEDAKQYYLSRYTDRIPTDKILGYASETKMALPALRQALEQHRVYAIFCNNAFELDDNTSAFCKYGGRLNHSCLPNIFHEWSPKKGLYCFRAMMDIPAGTELLISYTEEFLPRAERTAALEKYGFICTCEACDTSPFAGATEERRQELWQLEKEMRGYDSCHQTEVITSADAMWRYARMLELMESEPSMVAVNGLTGRMLGEVYLRGGRIAEAIEVLSRALPQLEVCFGSEDAEYVECKDLLEAATDPHQWASSP